MVVGEGMRIVRLKRQDESRKSIVGYGYPPGGGETVCAGCHDRFRSYPKGQGVGILLVASFVVGLASNCSAVNTRQGRRLE